LQVNSLSLLMLFTALISLLLSLYIYKRIKNPAMFNLLLILVAVTVWALGYGLELSTTNLQYMKIFLIFSYFGIATIPVLWLLFVARYAGKDGWLTLLNTALLFVIPVISIIFVVTNDLHNLFYSAYEKGFVGVITFLELTPGPFWWIHVTYSYLLILIGLYFLGSLYFRVVRSSRFPVSMFIAGSMLPYFANIAYVSGFKPYGFFDITPVAFIAMAVILIYGDTVKKALDVTPLAYDLLFRNIPDAIFVVDTQARVVNINPAAQKLLNYELKLWTADGAEPLNPLLTAQKLSMFSDDSEIEMGEKTYTVSVTPILSPGSNVLGQLIVLHDVTERKIIEQQLEQLSFNDQLTGLYNRRYFENELKRLDRSREHPIAVISADLDGLKQINDTFGHAEGDRYLKACAELLKNNLRASDVLARVGGDEFALLLPRTGKADAESFIARVRKQVEEYNRGRNKLPLRISLGLGVSEKASIPLEEAFRVADNNMYANKLQQGKKGLD
jgi:diguanylate cyclase (GGDEF)-like protein